jgi:hypothetical protein
LGFVDGPSVYGYARSNPQLLIDIKGLTPEPDKPSSEPTFPNDAKPSIEKQVLCIALHAMVDLSCKISFRKCFSFDSCEQLQRKILNRRNCLNARRGIQRVCYPADSGHDRIIESEDDGLQNCIKVAVEKGCGCPTP